MIRRWVGNPSDFIRETFISCSSVTLLVLALKGNRLAVIFGLALVGIGVVALIIKVKVRPNSTLIIKSFADLKAVWDALRHLDLERAERVIKVFRYEGKQLRDDEGLDLGLGVGFRVLPLIAGAGFGVLLWFLI